MKTSLLKVAFILTLGAPLFYSGCAGTTTRESTGEYVDDSALTGKVKAALVKDDGVHATDIGVETFKGVVQLSGFVNTSTEKQRAEALASAVTGVRSVKNSLQVKAQP